MKVLEEIDGGMVEREAVRWRDEVEGSSAEARLGVVRELRTGNRRERGKGSSRHSTPLQGGKSKLSRNGHRREHEDSSARHLALALGYLTIEIYRWRLGGRFLEHGKLRYLTY